MVYYTMSIYIIESISDNAKCLFGQPICHHYIVIHGYTVLLHSRDDEKTSL